MTHQNDEDYLDEEYTYEDDEWYLAQLLDKVLDSFKDSQGNLASQVFRTLVRERILDTIKSEFEDDE